MAVENLAFDVTPAGLVSALITEDGIRGVRGAR
jgi:methylthioribose-1-phosphate isomerase